MLQTVTNDAGGNVTFNVDYNKADTYTYTISEVVPDGAENNVKDHITYDTVGHNVTVNVTIDNKMSGSTPSSRMTMAPGSRRLYQQILDHASRGGRGWLDYDVSGWCIAAVFCCDMDACSSPP